MVEFITNIEKQKKGLPERCIISVEANIKKKSDSEMLDVVKQKTEELFDVEESFKQSKHITVNLKDDRLNYKKIQELRVNIYRKIADITPVKTGSRSAEYISNNFSSFLEAKSRSGQPEVVLEVNTTRTLSQSDLKRIIRKIVEEPGESEKTIKGIEKVSGFKTSDNKFNSFIIRLGKGKVSLPDVGGFAFVLEGAIGDEIKLEKSWLSCRVL